MPRTKQHSERGNAAALQQRVESAEAEATALRRQCKMLGTHVWLLQRELSQAERETQAMHAASSRMKPGARRRTRQNTTDTVGLNGLRIPSASGLSTSVTPEMLRPSCSTPDLTSLGERRPSISSSQGGRVSSAASSESLAPSPDVSPEKMRRPRSPMKTTELRRDTPSSSAGTPPPPLVQLARDGSGGGGAKPPAAPQRPQALVPQATAAAQQGSASSPSVSPQLLSLSVPMPVGAPGSELFDRPHSGDSPLLRGARSAGELSSLAAGLGSGPGAGSPLGAAHDASVARPSKLAVGSLQEYGCSTLQEASASASSTAAELDVCHTGFQPRTSRPQAGLLLTRLSLGSDRRPSSPDRGQSTRGRPARAVPFTCASQTTPGPPLPLPLPLPLTPTLFQVRQPNYARTALKAPSLEAMYEVVAQDTFLCPEAKLPHVARLLELTLTPNPHPHPNLNPNHYP